MRNVYLLLICLFLFFSSCDDIQNACTNEFRTIGLNVNGQSLSEHYTIRINNNDTLRFENYGFYPTDNYYVVIDDSYHHLLKNQAENFRFIGLINDSVVVNEVYFIKSDGCHVEKLNGVEEVNL